MKLQRQTTKHQHARQDSHKSKLQLKQTTASTLGAVTLKEDNRLSVPPQRLLELQRALGNQAVVNLVQRTKEPDMVPGSSDGFLQRESGQKLTASDVSTQDVQYEFIAHVMAYQNTLSDYVNCRLVAWRYLRGWQKVVFNTDTGLFTGLIKPHKSEQLPVLAFRGTNELADAASDLNFTAIGWDQFSKNKREIAEMIASAGGKVDATGHSLGGALAQIAAVEFPDKINKVITFQSPGVSTQMVEKFRQQKRRPQITHHIASGDIVDFGEDQHLPGSFYQHTASEYVSHNGNFIEAHNRFLSFTPEYRSHFEELGIDSEYLRSKGFKELLTKAPIEKFEDYPHKIRRLIASGFRRNSGLARALHYIFSGLK